MKKCLLLLAFVPVFLNAQTIFPYTDFNNFFKVFRDGVFYQIEHNPVSDVTIGDDFFAYMNTQKDFKVYENDRPVLITNQLVQFKMSDNMLIWNIGPNLYYRENGVSHNLTTFAGQYAVGDSLIVYQDTRFNTVNVVYHGKSQVLYQLTGDLYMPEAVGDNIVVFKDNGSLYKVFWRGQIYELGVWNSTPAYKFEVGTDVVCFNDPATRTFAIFENGQFLDVESVFVNKYKAGRDFIVYEDVQGNLKYYGKGERTDLSSFYQFWDVKDDVAYWGESNMAFSYIFGKKSQVTNYQPKDWQIKNDVVAFRNNLGGVSAYISGELKEITNLPDNEYFINNHSVYVMLKNRSILALFKGQVYRD